MTDILRRTEVIRYFKSDLDGAGVPVPGTEDDSVWVDVERLTGYTAESGSGFDFRRESWNLIWNDPDNTTREYDYLKIRLHTNESDADKEGEELGDDNLIVVPLPRSMVLENGSGADYQRHTLLFDNSEENESRDLSIFRIMHAEFKGHSEDVDITRTIYADAEVIVQFTKEQGRGADFQREIWSVDNTEIPLTEDLPQEQYRVREEPPSELPADDPTVVWPSHREQQNS